MVPRLACLEWPLLKLPDDGLIGLVGEYIDEIELGDCVGEVLMFVRVAGIEPEEIAFSRPAVTPLGVTGGGGDSSCSEGVAGCERMAFPSSESASKSSGGSRSFSISDLRLVCCGMLIIVAHDTLTKTYASSNPLIASLIPSDPDANVPYGSLLDPDTLLSSDTFSDSSLYRVITMSI